MYTYIYMIEDLLRSMRPIRSAAGRLDRLAGTDSEEEVLEKGTSDPQGLQSLLVTIFLIFSYCYNFNFNLFYCM